MAIYLKEHKHGWTDCRQLLYIICYGVITTARRVPT